MLRRYRADVRRRRSSGNSSVLAAGVADFINTLGNQAVQVIRSSAMPSQKIAYFQQLLREDFDLPGISRFVLGPYWRVASEAERQDFQNLLPDYLVRSTGTRFGNYNIESFEVTGTRSEPSAALVTSQLNQAGGSSVQLNAGVGNHHVQRPKAALRGFYDTRPTFFEADVLVKESCLAAAAGDLVHDSLTAGVVQIGYHDFGAFTRERRRTGFADT